MSFGVAATSLWVVLAVLPVLCTALAPQNFVYSGLPEVNANVRKSSPLQCYVCNSKYDSRCGDPFNPYSIGIINCSDRKPPEQLIDPLNMHLPIEPVVCRKSVQKVEGDVRVIRDCGYIRDDHDDKKCFRRTGTAAVEVIHCSCTKSLCNAGHPSQRPRGVVTLTVAISLAITSLLCRLSP